MGGIARFLIGALSVLLLILGVIGFMVSGMFASVPGLPEWLIYVMPFLALLFAILGLWSVVAKNIPAQYVFSIFILLGYPAGTVLGVILIILLSMSNKDKEA